MSDVSGYRKFSNDIKRTARGVRLARRIFSPGAKQLSNRQITAALRSVWPNIPRDADITLQAAQIFFAGEAVVKGIQAGKGMNSIVNPSVQAVNLAFDLAGRVGLVDMRSPESQDAAEIISFGSNVAQIISSGGTRIDAWVAAAADIYLAGERNAAIAKAEAYRGLGQRLDSLFSPQASAVSEILKKYQTNQGSLTGLKIITEIAERAPSLFPQFFPDFGWVPMYDMKIESKAWRTNWLGQYSEHSAWRLVRTMYQLNSDQAKRLVFQNLIEPIMLPFYQVAVRRSVSVQGPPSNLSSLMAIASIAGHSDIPDGFNYINPMSKALVSPVDIGDSDVISWVVSSFAPVTGGGIRGQREKVSSVWSRRNEIMKLAENGKLSDIAAIHPDFYTTLSKRYVVSDSSVEWRSLGNYIACLQLINDLKSDSFWASLNQRGLGDFTYLDLEGRSKSVTSLTLKDFDLVGSAQTFSRSYHECLNLSVVRRSNEMARYNLGQILGVKPNEVSKYINGGQ